MIRLFLWGWWLLRSLQRVQPAEGEPCALCGRTSSQPAIVSGDVTVRVPEGVALQEAFNEVNRQMRQMRRGNGEPPAASPVRS